MIMNELVCDRCSARLKVPADQMRTAGMALEDKYLVPQPWREVRFNMGDHDIMTRRATQDVVILMCGGCVEEFEQFLTKSWLADG